MAYNWRVEQSGKTTVTTANFEFLADADRAIDEFINASTTDIHERAQLTVAVYNAEPGEPVTLPNGKKLEIIDLGEQF